MIDIALLIILGIVTWCVAGEGVWGAALVLLSVLFGGFIAMNFFEPIAAMLSTGGGSWDYYWDFIALVGLFAVSVTLFRMATEYLMPVYVEVLPLLYDVGRWAFGFGAGYITMAFLAAAVHTAPLPREFAGWAPEQEMLFGLSPDRQWLAFTQYATEQIYEKDRIFDGERYPTVPEAWQAASSDFDKDRLMATWSSFPMRYAHRRQQFVRSGGTPAPAPAQTAPQPAPSSGSGGGTPNF
jgi:hypothetical protein